MKIAVVGSGYVGLVSAACLAQRGHRVACIDKNPCVVDAINNKKTPIFEKGLSALLKRHVGKRLNAFLSLEQVEEQFDAIMICVGTPCKDGSIDLEYVRLACVDTGQYLKQNNHYCVVTVKSTVLPKTTEGLARLLEVTSRKKCGRDFGLCMNPEFLKEGSAVLDFMNPDRIVIGGIDKKSISVLKKIYAGFRAPIIEANLRTAEMIKYASNSLLATLISFSNEIANICYYTGCLDIQEVMQAVHLDGRLNPVRNEKRINPAILDYLKAGCGFGGSCFPKDMTALTAFSRSLDYRPNLLESVIRVNLGQPLKVISILKSVYPSLEGLKIALLGLAFKPETDDVRESPALVIASELIKLGALVSSYDPIVKSSSLRDINKEMVFCASWEKALKGADAVIITTKWDEFHQISQDKLKKLMKKPVLIDTRRMFDKKAFSGICYYGIGWNDGKGR